MPITPDHPLSGRLALLLSVVGGIEGVLPRTAIAQAPAHAGLAVVADSVGLDLAIDYAEVRIDGQAVLRIRNIGSEPVREIPLLLGRLMLVKNALDARGVALRIAQTVTAFEDRPRYQMNAVIVRLEQPLPAGGATTLRVAYGGYLVGYTETGMNYVQDRVSRDFTILREEAGAFPVVGVPVDRINRATPRTEFPFDLKVTVPEPLQVATGGIRVSVTRRDSLLTYHYGSAEPVPFLNITIAPYGVLETAHARIFYFPADSARARALGAAVEGSIGRFTDWFGPLAPREERLSIMEIPAGHGSQADLVAGIILVADAFGNPSQFFQLYHELSHLWNPVDLERPSPRWNEGLATFLQARMMAELDGYHGVAEWTERTAKRAATLCQSRPECPTTPMVRYGEARLTDLSYTVGWLMFDLLYRVAGKEAFNRSLRGLFQEGRKTGVRVGDLVRAFETEAPATGAVFKDWLYSTRWYDRLSAGETLSGITEGYQSR